MNQMNTTTKREIKCGTNDDEQHSTQTMKSQQKKKIKRLNLYENHLFSLV
jgi:hypothetical protein